MTRKARRVSGVVDRRLNMMLTLDVEDIKNSTSDIAMMGQYGVNIVNFVEEAKRVVSEVNNESKVRIRLIRTRKGMMKVRFEGVEVCAILKAESKFKGDVDLKFVYNVARLMSGEDAEEEEVRRWCKHIGGTLLSMGVEVDEDL